MIILHPDGSLTTEAASERSDRPVKDVIEVPVDQVAQQPDLIDRIFAFAFDELGLKTIDVRIRPLSLGGHSGASCAVACV
jgi:hypothetical protein